MRRVGTAAGDLGVAREPTVMVNQVRRPESAAVSCRRHRRGVAGLWRLHLGWFWRLDVNSVASSVDDHRLAAHLDGPAANDDEYVDVDRTSDVPSAFAGGGGCVGYVLGRMG